MNIHDLKDIETPRLIIRPVQLGDEKALNAAINRSLESLRPWMPWAKDPSFDTTAAFISSGVAGWRSGKAIEFPMVVIEKETNNIISASGFNERSVLDVPYYEIGYWVDTQFQGQGFVTEFVNALSRYALDALGAKRIQICTQVENLKSAAVAYRCGFNLEATMQNERLDCITGKPADSLLFSCCDINDLPPLEINWKHNDESTRNQ